MTFLSLRERSALFSHILNVSALACYSTEALYMAHRLDMRLLIKKFAGGIERTKAQWENLLNECGLKILEVVNYDKDYEDSVIIAGLS